MKITERRLRQIIRSIIKESMINEDTPNLNLLRRIGFEEESIQDLIQTAEEIESGSLTSEGLGLKSAVIGSMIACIGLLGTITHLDNLDNIKRQDEYDRAPIELVQSIGSQGMKAAYKKYQLLSQEEQDRYMDSVMHCARNEFDYTGINPVTHRNRIKSRDLEEVFPNDPDLAAQCYEFYKLVSSPNIYVKNYGQLK